MTANQLAYSQNQENARHNKAYEAEINRHNTAQEAIDMERNRITDAYNTESIRIADAQNQLNQMKLEWEKTRDVVAWTGKYPNEASSIGKKGIVFDRQPTGSEIENYFKSYQAMIDAENTTNEQSYASALERLGLSEYNLTLEAQKTYASLAQSAYELKLKHDEQNKRFEVWESEIKLNKARRAESLAHQDYLDYQSALIAGQAWWQNFQNQYAEFNMNYGIMSRMFKDAAEVNMMNSKALKYQSDAVKNITPFIIPLM